MLGFVGGGETFSSGSGRSHLLWDVAFVGKNFKWITGKFEEMG
jgi:hypothetical protein